MNGAAQIGPGAQAAPTGELKRSSEGATRLADEAVQLRNRIESVRDALLGALLGAQPSPPSDAKTEGRPCGLAPNVNHDLTTISREFDRISNTLSAIEEAIY